MRLGIGLSIVGQKRALIERVANGGFATDTVWSKGAGWTIGSGVADRPSGSTTGITQAITLVPGVLCYCSMDVVFTGAGTIAMSFLGGTTVNGLTISGSGTYTWTMLPVTGNATVGIYGSTLWSGQIDNVSVRY